MIMPPWFLDLTDEAWCRSRQPRAWQVCRACGVTERPNSCNANLYEDWDADRAPTACDDVAAPFQDEKDSVGWHADDEPCFDAKHSDVLIISLSLGAVPWHLWLLVATAQTRTFVLRTLEDPENKIQPHGFRNVCSRVCWPSR